MAACNRKLLPRRAHTYAADRWAVDLWLTGRPHRLCFSTQGLAVVPYEYPFGHLVVRAYPEAASQIGDQRERRSYHVIELVQGRERREVHPHILAGGEACLPV